MANGAFVFYDPSGKRWNRFRRAAAVASVAFAVLVAFLVVCFIINPQLPSLGLPAVQHLADFSEVPLITRGEKAVTAIPFRVHAPVKVSYVRNGGNPVLHPKIAPAIRTGQPLVFGFYVNWDPASMVSLRFNLSRLTHLVPEWLTLTNAKGDLDDQSDADVIRIAHDAKLPILVEVNNFHNGWQAADLHRVLNNPAATDNLIDNILSNIHEHHFSGVNIDFEQLNVHDRAKMVDFVRTLKSKLQPEGLVLTQSVPVDDEAYDLKQLGALNDYIVPMVYDEHYQTSAPGPVASEQWFENQIDKLTKIVPPAKTVIGFGNYGYDWVIGSNKGAVETSYGDVIAAAEAAPNANITWDRTQENPVLRYQSGNTRHEVWFLDAVTALNHIQDVADDGFRGVALWRLGAEDPGTWAVLQNDTWPADNFNAGSLFKLTAQKSVQQYGDGEVLRITDTPHDGARNVWKDSATSDFFEQYKSFPSYYVVDSTGGATGKLMSITFDDGPSDYTSQVLDILKQKQVPATFFVIGENAEQYPSMIKREYAEGHTIGNHTYTHPNIAAESTNRTDFELNTTQRLIEHYIGRSTRLFRPPYNADSHPQTPAEIVPIERAQQMGYITVAESIDPRDWEVGTNASKILEQVLEQKDEGHLILLHDGGGDREATLQALPRIIDTLRAQGYQFVPVERLMNKTREQLMPSPGAEESRLASIEGEALTTKGNFKKILGLLFLGALYLTFARSVLFGVLAVIQKIRARRRRFEPGFEPGVSVIIAAYNEDKVIEKTVRSILNNGYPNLEVLVVDDGSKDHTFDVLQNAFGSEPRVRILTQANQGKSAALNHGIREAAYGILVALDADTIFRKGTIQKLVRHFSDPEVGAVSGNARVGNQPKWITRFQSIEYTCGFNLDRRALDLMNAITVVPGAVGAWRKDLIDQLGGFGDDTLAEDTDLTLALRRLGYAVRYEEEAIAYTEAPETTAALAKQRFRWAFGTLQAAWKHRDATFNPSYGFLGFVALPSIWIFQVLLAALSPLAEITMLIALFAGNWHIVLLYYFGLYLLELLTAALAYGLEGVAPWDLALLFFQRIYFRQLMYFVLAKSAIFALRGRLVGWGKLERTATVQVAG